MTVSMALARSLQVSSPEILFETCQRLVNEVTHQMSWLPLLPVVALSKEGDRGRGWGITR